jgi:hypothetical protein
VRLSPGIAAHNATIDRDGMSLHRERFRHLVGSLPGGSVVPACWVLACDCRHEHTTPAITPFALESLLDGDGLLIDQGRLIVVQDGPGTHGQLRAAG